VPIGFVDRASAFPRKRPYQLAVAALAAGLGSAAAEPGFVAALAALALLALACLRAPGLGLACAALLLAGGVAGSARLEAIDAPGRELADGGSFAGRAHLLERPRPTPFGSRAVLRIASGPGMDARLLARADRDLRWPADAGIGAELHVRGLVRRDRRRGDARFDFPAHLRRRGIAGELWLTEVRATGRSRGGLAGVVDAMRRRAR
jgi:hypothetical protein